jgi:anti-anti-sigma factor
LEAEISTSDAAPDPPDAQLDGLTVAVTRDGQAVVIAVAGELDIATVAQVSDAWSEVSVEEADAIVLDLSAVTFIDSSGLNALVRVAHEDQRQRLRMILSPRVARVVDLAHLGDSLPIADR